MPGMADKLAVAHYPRDGASNDMTRSDNVSGSRSDAVSDRGKDVSGSRSDAVPEHGKVRVVAFDRVPFGFSSRPSSWDDGDNPYTVDAGKCGYSIG